MLNAIAWARTVGRIAQFYGQWIFGCFLLLVWNIVDTFVSWKVAKKNHTYRTLAPYG